MFCHPILTSSFKKCSVLHDISVTVKKTRSTGEKERLLLTDEQMSALYSHQGNNRVLFMSTQGFAAVHSCTLQPSLFQTVTRRLSELLVALCLCQLADPSVCSMSVCKQSKPSLSQYTAMT